jgi:DNA-binding NarL/FixJ family response regulator
MAPARVLIVDDEAGIRRAWGRTLVGAGYELRDAGSFAAAHHLLRNWTCDPCDLILLDLNLGDGCGADLLPFVDGLRPRPAVAILSGYLTNEAILRVCNHCVVCLSKPIDASTLIAATNMLARRQVAHDVVREYARHKGLSNRETEVLLAAVGDGGIDRTAADLSLRPTTVTSYWRRVFGKTNRHSQREVLADVLQFVLARCHCQP